MIEDYILHTYKKFRPNLKPWFTTDCNFVFRAKMEAHKNFSRDSTPQTNGADVNALNSYNKTFKGAR